MGRESLYGSFIVFKWLNMPVTVPSSWSISKQLITCKSDPYNTTKIKDRDPNKNGMRG